ncbi:MAG: 16S rRNA (guanine(527)-N(7))-methyltransferase RsmG [Ignavibacteria bacterium]|nr:16S rRNA (guanine(527)-N(7))-methyltransferase RsmG [Ignavibacteria bacterium]
MTENEDTASENIEPTETPDILPRMSNIDCWTACSANNILLEKEQVFTLERYVGELQLWNLQVNMISRKDSDNVWEKHILHSLTLLKYVDFKPKARVLDIGTGGGLPGIPLKIARPDLKCVLVDSIRKKAQMTKMFAEHTMLKDIEVVHVRVEELVSNKNYVNGFNVIVSRAVAPMFEIIEWSKDLLSPGGKYAFLKGGNLEDEIHEAKRVHSGLVVKEQNIQMFGVPSFTEDDKKVVTCWFE